MPLKVRLRRSDSREVRFGSFELFPPADVTDSLGISKLEGTTAGMTAQRREDIEPRLPNPEPEDKELTLAFQRGEKGAYQAIYDRYHQRVLNVCRRMLGKPEDAEEAAQEAFLRVYQALYRFNGRYQLGPWVTRIATNVCLDHLRSRARKPSEATTDEVLELEIDTSDEDPEVIHLKRFEGRRVRRVLASLPPMHRAAIVLRDFEGLSYEEVAIALGISEVQVKALIHRARKSFKRAWVPLDALQAILPWKLVQKFKKVDVSAGEGATQVARASAPLTEAANSAAHVAHAASSCSIAVQQCGQFMAERATALAATVIVGTAAIGGVAAGRPAGSPPQPAPTTARSSASIELRSASSVKAKVEKPRQDGQEAEADSGPAAPSSQPSSETQQPTATPSSAPSPSASPAPPPAPAPTSTPAGSSSAKKDDGASVQPTPPPFVPALGFVTGSQQPAPSSVSSHTFAIDCVRGRFEQSLHATISHEGKNYPAILGLRIWDRTGRIEMTVRKDGRDIHYSSWGAEPVASWTPNGTNNDVALTGEYGQVYASEDPQSVGLPSSGNFQADLSIDCKASRVATQRVAFHAP